MAYALERLGESFYLLGAGYEQAFARIYWRLLEA
jgi:hypothetical protein